MEKITRFEKRRTKRWMMWFLMTIFILVSAGFWSLYRSYTVLAQQSTFDVLEIMGEDWDVITEYWKEIVSTIVIELPQWTIALGVVCIILFTIVWINTSHTRTVAKRRIIELAKRNKNHDNTKGVTI